MKPKALYLLLIIFAILNTIYFCDGLLNNGIVFNKIFQVSDCNYSVPHGYAIVYSAIQKKYAVKVLQFEDYYLHNGKYGITTAYSHLSEPSLFHDSCSAKAFLKDYIEDQNPKFK